MSDRDLWRRYCDLPLHRPRTGLTLDVSRMTFDDAFLARMEPAMQAAFAAMDELEGGAIANPDENRMVGHYWLRAPELAPTAEITFAIRDTLAGIKVFATRVHRGEIKPPKAAKFTQVLSIGIGGSALGPEFVHDALGTPADKMAVHFIDNTDPDGMARVLSESDRQAGRDAGAGHQQERRHAGAAQRHDRRRRRVQEGRARLRQARRRHHRRRLAPRQAGRDAKAGWCGSRCGTGSAAGPARRGRSAWCRRRLQGIDIDAMLAGAAACDVATRIHDTAQEPRRPDGPRPGTTPPAARGRRTWSSCRTRIGCCSSAGTCSNW